MRFNLAYPLTGAQKKIEIDDDKKCSIFFDKRMGAEIEADALGDDFKGYIFKIMGGNDKDGFPMKQGVMVKGRCRLLLSKGHSTYRPRRKGERKRKSVRGCIVGQDIQVLCLSVIKKGEKEIPGLTDRQCPRTLGPKRATKIRKLFNLTKEEGQALIKKNVVRRTWTTAAGKKRQKAPKIQRIVTDDRLRRKRIQKSIKKEGWKKEKAQHDEFKKLIQEWKKKKLTHKAAEEKAAEEKKDVKAPAKADDKKKQAAKPADSKAQAKKTDKKPEVKKDEKKPVEKKPETKKDEKKPVEKKAETKPAAEKKPAEKKDDKKPAEKKDAKKPETKK